MTDNGATCGGQLISIIGPVAVGKTTLACALATLLSARLICEDYVGNPFLAESYVGSDNTRLPSQLYFLLSRVAQLSCENFDAPGPAVSDYGFCQDDIYAKIRLSEADLKLYRSVAARMNQLVQRPDVLIHLDATVDTLCERIAHRGRDYEAAMTRQFHQSMRAAHVEAADKADCPVIRIDCDEVDIRQAQTQSEIIDQLRALLECK